MTYINNPVVRFDPSNMSVFGTLETGELTPLFQGDFVYGINTQLWNTPVVSGTGASVDTNNSRLRIQSGTSVNGYAYIESRRYLRYRAGQGNVIRITPLFNSVGLANNIQLWGIGDVQANVPYDGYFLGYNGTSFGIAHYNRGTPSWIYQSSWNGDKVDGSAGSSFTLNPSLGNVLQIKYPFLGYGVIEFFILNPFTGRFVLVHTIQYPNTSNITQLSNPSLHVMGYTANTTNTTNSTMYSGSVGAFLSGERSFIGNPKWAMDRTRTTVTTEISLLNLKCATTYNGIPNQGSIRINQISFSSSIAASVATLKFRIGATIAGTPVYTPINGTTADGGITITAGNSIASYDTAGTTLTGGTYIYNLSVGGSGGVTADLTPLHIFVGPGEILSISGLCSSSSSLAVSINWSEDI